ncbi:CheA signal transduction histidine kinase [Thalassoporum mexicanum PCC 7367]|uniref:response regulator n=1 Tax=Thalassoporum mexicanum TaxID=3457544 RepID=UPI00029FD361|nr:response regulator [Pseudanabaena sp. PCC 7367]AFY70397.1 CheA signal transduction histidine kinase [Pseudanabaena sp. PCC 7367]
MAISFDAATLAAINLESRQCFLYDDLPKYLEALQQGLEKLQQGQPDYTALMHAAHSLKGGSGIAQLPSLSKLAHKFEDILELLRTNEAIDRQIIGQLLEQGINEIVAVVDRINALPDNSLEDVSVDLDLLELLSSTLAMIKAETATGDNFQANTPANAEVPAMVRAALEKDLEACLTHAAQELDLDPVSIPQIKTSLAVLAEECLLLSETFELEWLTEPLPPLIEAVQAHDRHSLTELRTIGKQVITALRHQRSQYLQPTQPVTAAAPVADFTDVTEVTDVNEVPATTAPTSAEPKLAATSDLDSELDSGLDSDLDLAPAAEIAALEPVEAENELEETADLGQPEIPGQELTATKENPENTIPLSSNQGSLDLSGATNVEAQSIVAKSLSYVRVPSDRMKKMSNMVGELIIRHERLVRQQQQISQTSRNLQNLVQGLAPVQDYIQSLYDQLTVSSSLGLNRNSNHNANTAALAANGEGNANNGGGASLLAAIGGMDGIATFEAGRSDFDALELDQYTSTHISLQGFQELLLRIKETRSDIDISSRELAEEITQLRQELDALYKEFTASRLVPFKTLAQRFTAQLARLCQKHGKDVNLEISGAEVLVDQTVLERLQTPLNHLLVNAFDHGIESPSQRRAQDKPATATIALEAMVEGTQVIIRLRDDGSGIEPAHIYQQAIAKGMADHNPPIAPLSSEEMLNFIFQPGFSTAATVSSLSGRGMGLDIVRSQVKKLRGNINIATQVSQGTEFTITLPIELNLLPMMVCNLNAHSLGILATSVLDIIMASEMEYVETEATDITEISSSSSVTEAIATHPPSPTSEPPATKATKAINTTHSDTATDANHPKLVKWRRQEIPLIPLSKLLAYGNEYYDQSGAEHKVGLILDGGDSVIAVKVDTILEQRELIIKPFDNTLPMPSYLSGCAILGTGRAVPVIVPSEIVKLDRAYAIGKKTPPSLRSIAKNQPPSIVIAEDSVATRRLLERILKQSGYDVISCRDGKEALDIVSGSSNNLKLLISDIEMPRLNGFGLLQAVRDDQRWHNLPVVFLTSRSGQRHRDEAAKLGVNAYINKPFTAVEILKCVNSFVG